uniref:Uncharacterized protein n=1 Tax=Drosophila pseudoobscura pseudoobscura TaxID=46245 RepID=B5DSY3_DROPS
MTWAWLNDIVHPSTSRDNPSGIITVEAMRSSDSDEEVRAGRAQQEPPSLRRRKHPGQGAGTAVTPRATRRRVEPGHVDPKSEVQNSSPVAHKLRLRAPPPLPYYLYRMGNPQTPRPNHDSSSNEGFTSPTMEAEKHWEPTHLASTDEEVLHDQRFGKAGGRPWVKHSVLDLNRQLEAERATTGSYSDVSEDEEGPADYQKSAPANSAVDVASWTTWKNADQTLQLLLAHPQPITPPRPEREIIPASHNDTASSDESQLLGEDDTTPLRIRDSSPDEALPRRLRNITLPGEDEPPRRVTGNELPQLLQERGIPIPRVEGDEEVARILGGQENPNGPIPDTSWDDGWHAQLQEWDAQEEAAAPERKNNRDWQPLDYAPMEWLSPAPTDPTDPNAPNPDSTGCTAREAEPGNPSRPKEDSDLSLGLEEAEAGVLLTAFEEMPELNGLQEEQAWPIAPVAWRVSTPDRRIPQSLLEGASAQVNAARRGRSRVRSLEYHDGQRFRVSISGNLVRISPRHTPK